MSTADIVMILAVLAGPIAAVFVTRAVDDHRLKQDRRMTVFRDLMRTRRLRVDPVHVSALNLVEIEFYGQKPVIDAWKTYMAGLASTVPTAQEELVRFGKDQDKMLTKLLHAMAKSLRFEIEQLEIFEGGYSPQAWATLGWQQEALTQLTLELLRGNRPLPITPVVAPTPSMPYPPPPGAPNIIAAPAKNEQAEFAP